MEAELRIGAEGVLRWATAKDESWNEKRRTDNKRQWRLMHWRPGRWASAEGVAENLEGKNCTATVQLLAASDQCT